LTKGFITLLEEFCFIPLVLVVNFLFKFSIYVFREKGIDEDDCDRVNKNGELYDTEPSKFICFYYKKM